MIGWVLRQDGRLGGGGNGAGRSGEAGWRGRQSGAESWGSTESGSGVEGRSGREGTYPSLPLRDRGGGGRGDDRGPSTIDSDAPTVETRAQVWPNGAWVWGRARGEVREEGVRGAVELLDDCGDCSPWALARSPGCTEGAPPVAGVRTSVTVLPGVAAECAPVRHRRQQNSADKVIECSRLGGRDSGW